MMKQNAHTYFSIIVGFFFTLSAKVQELISLDEFEFKTSSKISSQLLMKYDQFFTFIFQITPNHLGLSNGKGLRLDYTSQGHYLFIAIDDDKPFAIYDSQIKQTVEGEHVTIETGKAYDLTINVHSNGVEATLIDEKGQSSMLCYEKEIGSEISVFLQCQRSGATFQNVSMTAL